MYDSRILTAQSPGFEVAVIHENNPGRPQQSGRHQERTVNTVPHWKSMLQALLWERFHLQVHTETREFTVYKLVVSLGGVKMV